MLPITSPALWGNMPPPSYRVNVPEGAEPLYEWAGPTFLALAGLAAGWWLMRAWTLRTGPARALLWAVAGCLAVSFSARWVWANRGDVIARPGWGDWAAASMPWLWPVACVLVIGWGWKRARPPAAPAPDSPTDPGPTGG